MVQCMEVRCPNCGQLNRVPALEGGKTAVCGKCKSLLLPGGGNGVAILSDADFDRSIAKGKWVVDFWAAWCGPCRMIAPVIEELADERGDVRFGKLNVDDFPTIAAKFNARSIPLLVLFKDGAERGRVVGAVPRGHIEAAIRQHLG
jgi:thioredoxin